MRAPVVTSAILLRAVAYGESDRVVTLLGRSTGRVTALARGARKSMRRFSGGLGLGASGQAALRERAGAELMLLESFEATSPRLGLAGDMARTAHAAYAVELCDRLCAARQPEPASYDWLEEFLHLLEAGRATAERLRVFELGLLKRLGLGPSVERCVACNRDDLRAEQARWLPDRGGLVCRNCARQGAVLSAPVRSALVRLGQMRMSDADTAFLDKGVSAGCRQAMLELLRHHIPGPLRSVEFISKLGGAS